MGEIPTGWHKKTGPHYIGNAEHTLKNPARRASPPDSAADYDDPKLGATTPEDHSTEFLTGFLRRRSR